MEFTRISTGPAHFLGEQDGGLERDFKLALGSHLPKHNVARAYLAQVEYSGSPGTHVALCLVAPEDSDTVKALSAVFHGMFSSRAHLDILFVASDAQEAALRSVCPSFYVAPSNS